MPTHRRDDEKPVVTFDARVELSPFVLFRRLGQGRAPALVDVQEAGARWTLRGALSDPGARWRPQTADEEAVLFDTDGSRAVELAARLQAEGFTRVRALFGGLELWRFALDPEVVGEETFLVEAGTEDGDG